MAMPKYRWNTRERNCSFWREDKGSCIGKPWIARSWYFIKWGFLGEGRGSAYLAFQPPVYLLFSLKWWRWDQRSRFEASFYFTFIIEGEPMRISGKSFLDPSSKWKFSLKNVYSTYIDYLFFFWEWYKMGWIFSTEWKIITKYVAVKIYCVRC